MWFLRKFELSYFDIFQIVTVSFIAEFYSMFCCFVFRINQLKIKMWIIIQLRLQINSLLMISEDSALFIVKQLQCIFTYMYYFRI